MEEGEQPALEALLEEVRAELSRNPRLFPRPASTYRLQLHAGFGFDAAAAQVPYLHALGVTHLYLSPILAAAPGSKHGYDVVDHGRLNPELGGEAAYERLCAALAERGMGQLVDFVPNHMGVGPENRFWMEVLENGPSSEHARLFDVDWRPVKGELENKVLVPILGDQYGKVLERGELKLSREGGALWLGYYEHRFPIAPRQVPQVLRHGLPELKERLGATNEHVQELESLCTALEKLAPRSETDPRLVEERAREKEVAKRRLAALCEASPELREFVDGNVRTFNGTPGEPRSFDLLDKLLDAQAFRLAHWRVAGEEINYRRFFDVNALAAIRMEDPQVFDEAHRLTMALLRQGRISGLRIDHPDGLYDPPAYFRALQARAVAERARARAEARGERVDDAAVLALAERVGDELAQGALPPRPLYVVAEKILMAGEQMPPDWAVDGATGYEFVAAANGLFVDPAHGRAFTELYTRYTGRREDFREVAWQRKKLVMSSSMASEINMLAHRLNRISESDRRTRDFTLNDLTRALVEYVAAFPVYRTYVTPDGRVSDRDRAYVDAAIARARRRSPVTDPSIYDFVRDAVLLRMPEELTTAERALWREFAMKLQQVTGPVTAKAIEDTAFYVYLRLASLNEVGGEPRDFGASPSAFHDLCAGRRARWPGSLNATSTHDTKRSEDVRVRIDALSEIPAEWRGRLALWGRLNRRHERELEDGLRAPDRNDQLLVYQTLVGSLPDEALAPGARIDPAAAGWQAYRARILAYLEKALREAKLHTSWTSVNAEYEAAARGFVEGILAHRPFLDDLAPFAARVAQAGRLSSLAQVALKCAAPGVCDVYQGCELWDLSLVDPDNRRPVDFARRAGLLDAIDRRLAEGPEARAALAREVSSPEGLRDGRAKLWLLREGLRLRREAPELFLEGTYLPLEARGRDAGHLVAFARTHRGRRLLCAVPRLTLSLLDAAAGGPIAWEGELPLPPELAGRYQDLVTGEPREGGPLALSALFGSFPVALLVGG
ncbi:malto-oligosyltrehalose synthase [Anaeromyxobacter paludicola]|uniref:Maltooligosyl trehalose synthase n=1 Tax=Anaeromyxobacter paludicola TaxID=2918171 RepID=A0ABM7XC50_9BACT|nr:malto-oligosyltrehalose synthase [Anaeromyxobacter paludicola]BDG09438.1 maltooligosyl trehalose synthase [Anaeromyxobacter paludicola]